VSLTSLLGHSQLEEELRVEDLSLRTMATHVLGEKFADKGGADIVRKYPTTWIFWNLRRNDKSPAGRLVLVEASLKGKAGQ
jgi:sister-chromatid-cohesion protein PDS5